MRIEKVTVSREVAEEWLGRNIDNNRSVSRSRVRRMAGDMKNGRWKRNGETIKFDQTGRLVDGQHRLYAVKEADVTIDLDVAYDTPLDAIATIDTGRARGVSDVLFMAGEPVPRILGASSKIVINYLDGLNVTYGQTTPTIQSFIKEFPEIREFAQAANVLHGEIPPSPIAALLFLASVDGTRAPLTESFLQGVATGANLSEGDPRLTFRNSIANYKARMTASRTMDTGFVFHTAARCWNAYVQGRSLAMAKYIHKRSARNTLPDVAGGPRVGVGLDGLRAMIKERTNRRVFASVGG